MKRRFTLYIATLLFITCTTSIIVAQEYSLKLSSNTENDTIIFNKIKYKKIHKDSLSLFNEITNISSHLKNKGYFTNTIDSISKTDSIFTSYITLGLKTEKIIIRNISPEILNLFHFKKQHDSIYIPIEELQSTLHSISKTLDRQGKSFSKVQLSNIFPKKNNLYADLNVHQSKKRTIDRVIVKGYDLFSTSHVKHFLDINKKTIFNQEKLKDVSKAIKSLSFVSEIKPPEVLFSKDSTLLYIYVKKERVNTFDGLMSFTSKENEGGVLFNGYLDLKLNNILNTGESFELNWKANGEERQQFKIATKIPYIFNSAFSPELSFQIYKHDSTFLNTKFNTRILYNLNRKTTIGATFDSESSENLLQNTINNTIDTFDNSFYGIDFSYRIPNDNIFNTNKFYLRANPSFGNRTAQEKKTSQFKLFFTTSFLWNLNRRNSFFIKNETGYLDSKNFIENEIFRIGGANSIRGFNEQSIFTSQYSFFSVEYRYLTSSNSYLYSISDFGTIKTINTTNENIFGVGFGYLISLKNTRINLGYAIGKTTTTDFDFDKSKLLIKIESFF